jgi:general secretion pathway protein D
MASRKKEQDAPLRAGPSVARKTGLRPWLSLTLAVAIAVPSIQWGSLPSALSQTNDDLDRLFDDDEDLMDMPGGFNNNVPPPPPPPPPGPSQPADANPPAGFPNDPGGGSGGGRFPNPQGMGGSGKGIKMDTSGKKKPSMADANIEDITNENYPDLIESFDYPNAEITDVIKAMSQLTGKNFIIDPAVRGKISIIAPSQITMAEAWKAFLAALAVNQFTVIPYGKFLKVKSTRNAGRDSIETYSGKYYPNSDVLITRIVHLKHISADEVNKRLRILPSKDGEMTPYEPTNSLIITDFGSNIERIMKIINELDRPGFEEQLAVVQIRHAKAKEIAELINQIINKDPTRGGGGGGGFGAPGAPGFGGGVPRFRSRGQGGTGVPEELSLVAPDDRTNAIIVVGNSAGIEKVRSLVKKLDYKLDPNEAGGVFVYYVRFGEAEKIAQTLSGIAQGGAAGGGASAPAGGGFGGGGGFGSRGSNPLSAQSIFGGDVKITADKNTNSLVITAAKTDYEIVLAILAKLDIPKDQVFVEAIIMELNSQKRKVWNPNYYGFAGDRQGIGRSGFLTTPLPTLINPMQDEGVILGFGSQNLVELNIGGTTMQVPNLLAFLKLIQTNVETNILSTPRLLAQDNEESEIEVGDNIPISQDTITAPTTGVQTSSPKFEKASIKLKITPYIRPDSNIVRLKVDQSVKQKAKQSILGDSALAKSTITISDRALKTNLTIHSGDTAVLGGLVRDQEDVSESKVPILGDIPILGWLFKSRSVETNKINLVMFLTPKIIRSQDDGHNNLNKVTNERIDWIKKNFDGRDPYGKKVDSLPRAKAAGIGDDVLTGRDKK